MTNQSTVYHPYMAQCLASSVDFDSTADFAAKHDEQE